MTSEIPDDPPPPWTDDLLSRIDQLTDEYRETIDRSLDGLTEEEASANLLPSKTTLLGIVKHVTFVEGVWFDQAITGRTYAEIGIATSPDRSFTLEASDTIDSVRSAYRLRCEQSRATMAGLGPDEIVDGRGFRPVWALKVQVLRELARHAGHADILREQTLTHRDH